MPMNEEEKRREYRSGYDPRGNQAQRTNTAAGANRWGGVWDSVRSEMNALSNPQRTPGNPSFMLDMQDLGRKVLPDGRFPRSAQEDRLRMQEHRTPWEPQLPDAREKRLAQAGFTPPAAAADRAPVMAESVRDPKDRARSPIMNEPPPQDGGLGAGPGGKPPLSESSATKTGSRTGPGVFRKGIGDAMQVAESDREYMGAAPATDPRKRYMDMANMSLEQREQFLNSLPEGQRPIQTIRGNREGWYNPALSQEFGSIPEAMSGVAGRPTYASEEKRREEALDRSAGIDKQRYASDMAYRARIDSQHVSEAGQDRRAALGKGAGKGEGWDTFVQKGVDETGNPTEKTLVWNKALGPHTIIEPKHTPAKAISSAILGDWQNEKARDGWLPMFEYLDANKVAEIATTMPPDVREYYRTKLKEKASKKNEK